MSEHITISIIEETGDLRTQAWLTGDDRDMKDLVFSSDKAKALVMNLKTAKQWLTEIFERLPRTPIHVKEIRITAEAE